MSQCVLLDNACPSALKREKTKDYIFRVWSHSPHDHHPGDRTPTNCSARFLLVLLRFGTRPSRPCVFFSTFLFGMIGRRSFLHPYLHMYKFFVTIVVAQPSAISGCIYCRPLFSQYLLAVLADSSVEIDGCYYFFSLTRS